MSLLKVFKAIVSILLIPVMFTGCMNSIHLKDLMIVEAMSVDKSENNVRVGVQTLKLHMTSGGEAPDGNMTIISSESGETIIDAMTNLSKNLSKKIFFGQNKLIIFSRELCEQDFGTNMDYFIRSSDARGDVSVCIAENKAEDILKSKENGANVPGENIVHLMNNGQDSGISVFVTTGDLLNMHSDKTSDIYMPVLKKNTQSDSASIAGIGLFNNNNLVYITDDDETRGISFILGKADNCNLEFDTSDYGKVGVELRDIRTSNKVSIKDGGVVFYTDLKAQLMINEIEKGAVTQVNAQMLDEIRKAAQEYVGWLCNRGFEACQSCGSDALRVGEFLAKDSPESYERLSDEWDMYFKTVKYSVKTSVDLMKISNNTQIN